MSIDRVRDDVGGIDVHRDTAVASVRDRDGNVVVRTFGTTVRQLSMLVEWLVSHSVALVAMEATGVYWKPVFYVLEQRLECWLLNARHMHNVPGRKTDVGDSEWILDIVECGLVRPSFVPPRQIRELRNLTRYRRTVVEGRGREIQRLHKVLEDAGVKLASFTSKVLSVSGREMIEDLIAGNKDFKKMSLFARGRMRAKIPQIEEALDGRFDPAHHGFLAREMLDAIDAADLRIERLSARIAELCEPMRHEIELLCTIPGVGLRTAEVIVAECGVDMSRFPTDKNFASWAGMCPGNNASGGKRKSARTRHGSKWLRIALVEAAHAAARTKDTYLASHYARIRGRRGPAKAAVATGHSILVSIYHMLERDEEYRDLGGDYFAKRNTTTAHTKRLIKQLEDQGYEVTKHAHTA